MTQKLNYKIISIILVVIFLATAALYANAVYNLQMESKSSESWKDYALALQDISGLGSPKPTHIHADFAVYVEGKKLEFADKKYDLKNHLVHLHLSNPNGDKVVHVESTGITIGHFLNSLGLSLDRSCLTANSRKYCEDNKNVLGFYVNGVENKEYPNYVVKDGDRLLVTYHGKDYHGLQVELDSVTDFARYYSEHPDAG